MSQPTDKAQIAQRLVEAISKSDAAALGEIFAPDATIWHSTDQLDMDLPALQGMLGAIGTIATAEVEQTSLRETSDGFVLTLKSTYTLKNGETTSFHAAQVNQVNAAGKIIRVDEYLDSGGLGPLIRALG